MLHDVLRSDALGKGRSVGGMHRSLTKLFGFHELLRVLPDLSSVCSKREPQPDEVRLSSAESNHERLTRSKTAAHAYMRILTLFW